MEVVINIPDELYEGIKRRDGSLETEYVCDELMKAVDDGTVLPKRHGRLIDADKTTESLDMFYNSFVKECNMTTGKFSIVCIAPIVIEADKEDK